MGSPSAESSSESERKQIGVNKHSNALPLDATNVIKLLPFSSGKSCQL